MKILIFCIYLCNLLYTVFIQNVRRFCTMFDRRVQFRKNFYKYLDVLANYYDDLLLKREQKLKKKFIIFSY